MFEFMLLGIFYPFIAYSLGFCIYCSTFWITMLILILFLTSWDSLPKWQDTVIGIIAAEDAMAALMLAAIIKKESEKD